MTLMVLAPCTLAQYSSPAWDTYSDTWVATDALARNVPTAAEVGPPRQNRIVAMFYFLWLGQHGNDGPFDITKILAEDPTAISNPNSPLWGPMGSPHHWGESVFGYYVSDDDWVLRKHAQMLSDAGVDVVFFDVTNQLTYPQSYLALCRTWSQVRQEGGKTPQIGFLSPFWNPVKVVQTLYNDLYKPGQYSDLWFRWEGKPLILADPGMIKPEALQESQRVPGNLRPGGSYGQTFTATRPFTAMGGSFPTYNRTDSGMTLSLYAGGAKGDLLLRQRFENVKDNATVLLPVSVALPRGTYYLEQSEPKGQIGWWSGTGDIYDRGRAYENGNAVSGDRTLSIQYAGDATPTVVVSGEGKLATEVATKQAADIHAFFTFRKPQPDYFTGPRGPGEWGWLDVYPQKYYYKTPGVPEQMTVGVAQNAVDGKLAVLSNPRSYGRSFHDGQEPGPEGQDFSGHNFAEQWQRALQVDPPIIWITGWNEWIAGRFGADAPFHGAGPVSFVDEFNHEYSRDVEPVVGGHTDSYYYQLVSNVRRYKGARAPVPASPPRTIKINHDFRQWQSVQPEFRDDRFDTARRDHPGWGSAGTYRNTTGRNDFVRLKVAHDARNVYFYAQTREPITNFHDPDWMMLLLDVTGNGHNGWEGFDFVVNRTVLDAGNALLEQSTGGWNWQRTAVVRYAVKGNELHLAIPRAALGLTDQSKALRFDFKWMDNVGAQHDLLNLYRNGDAAPNGRFRYRYVSAMAR